MENQDNTQTTPPGPEMAAPMPQQQADLSITDLANIRSVIEVAIRRGVFAAAEVSSVGAVYDKLNSFLNAVQQKQQDQQPAPSTEQ